MQDALELPIVPEPNATICIDRLHAVLVLGDTQVCGALVMKLRFIPTPRLLLEFEVPGGTIVDIAKPASLILADSGRHIACEITKASLFSTEPQVVTLHTSQDLSWSQNPDTATRVTFSLPNAPEFWAPEIAIDDKGWPRRREVIRLSADGWVVAITLTPDIKDRKHVLRTQGGYAITATGTLERANAEQFDLAEAEWWLEALRMFLSFAFGKWTAPLLATGLHANGDVVWQIRRLPLMEQGLSVFTWFDTHHGACLSDVFPGFISKWKDSIWKRSILHALYWFVRANSNASGADGSLILSQAALDTLSWTYLVESSGIVSRTQFKKLSMAERIRTFLSELGIPTLVPASLEALSRTVSERNWIDGPGAIAAIRNDLVHPEKSDDIGPIADAWLVSQRLLELALLRLFHYNGKHGASCEDALFLTGESPVRVSAEAPGSRLQSGGEIRRAERSVESP